MQGIAEVQAPQSINFRAGEIGPEVERLTQQTNFENRSVFFRALIKQLAEVTDGEPFDVRDLVLKSKTVAA